MAGKYRHRISIEVDSGTTENDHGQVEEDWTATTALNAWAEIDTGSSRKYFAAQQQHSELTHLVTIPYNSAISVSGKYRVVWGTRTLNLLGPPIDKLGQHREWELRCVEAVT